MLSKYNINEIVGLGLALHGIVDNKEGISVFSPHFRWRELNIKELLEKLYKMPIIVENDVRAMAIAEHEFGNAEKLNSFVMLYISNGIGSSIVIDGKPFEGNTYSAGEIGHYVVKENSTTKCSCGKYGCLEAEFSDQAIKDKVSWYFEVNNMEQQREDNNMKIIYEKATERKEPYYSIVKEASYEIGKALGNVLNVLNINSIFDQLYDQDNNIHYALRKKISNAWYQKRHRDDKKVKKPGFYALTVKAKEALASLARKKNLSEDKVLDELINQAYVKECNPLTGEFPY